MTTVHLIISGKVQGVFYRASAREMADRLGIQGWIKNTAEGNVEVMASGNEPELQRFIAWCREGPPKARVDDIVIIQKQEMQFEGFAVLRE